MWWWLLACSPESVPSWEADASRTAPSGGEPTLAFEAPVGVRRWNAEGIRGECREYDGDGTLWRTTLVTNEGRPLVVEGPQGRQRWYRRRWDNGALREVWVIGRGPSGVLPGIHEVFDWRGRLRRREYGGYKRDEWSYDLDGRLTREHIGDDADPHEFEYTYTDAGAVATEEWQAWDAPGDHRIHRYTWEGALLVGVSAWGVWSDSAGLEYTSHSALGLPQEGSTWWEWSDGTGGVGTVEWTYHSEGRPLTYVVDGQVADAWEWEGDHPVVHEVYGKDDLAWREEWAWDEEGRPVLYDDGRGRRREWEWAPDGDLATYVIANPKSGEEWPIFYEGDCPPSLFRNLLPDDPTPSPLPRIPTPPLPHGG